MGMEAIPVGNNLETAAETRCLKELCGDESAFMGLDDQSLLIRLTEKDDNDFVDLDLKVPRSQVSFGSDGQKIDSVLHVVGDEMSYISAKELLPKFIVPPTSLVPAIVVEHTTTIVIPSITVTAESCQAPSETLANGSSRMTAATRPINSLVSTSLIAPPITMVLTVETTTSMMSTTSVTSEITVAPPAYVVSTMVSNRTSGPSTPMQGVPIGRVGQNKSKMGRPRVSTYIWTNAVDLNRKGSFGVSNTHLRAFKGKPGVPGIKSISTLNSAYLGEYPFQTKEDLVNLEYEPEYGLDFSLHAEMFLYQCLEKKGENRLKLGPNLNSVYRDRWFAKMEENDVTNQSSPSPLIQTMKKMKKEML